MLEQVEINRPNVREDADEPPPFLGRWPRLYAAVLWYLLALICVLYGITRLYSY